MEPVMDNVTQPKVNFHINDGEVFFAHELSVNYNPTQFVLDFKCITPRVDPRSHDGTTNISLKHNTILLEVYYAKKIAEFLLKRVADYEKEFGKINKPASIRALEKKRTKKQAGNSEEKTTKDAPSYFG